MVNHTENADDNQVITSGYIAHDGIFAGTEFSAAADVETDAEGLDTAVGFEDFTQDAPDEEDAVAGSDPAAPSRGRIAVYSIDAKLPGEVKGATRYTFLCSLLAQAGYEVDFITSRFQHWDKEMRSKDFAVDAPYAVHLIDEPGYPKNMCPQRIWSHHIMAKNVADFFERDHAFDLVYCQIPPNDVAAAVAEAAERYRIPLIIDVNDLWPEAFRVALDVPVVSNVAFAPFYAQAKRAYSLADAIVGTSDEYASRPFSDRPRNIPKLVVYVGNDLAEFDRGVDEFALEIDRPEGELWIAYAGTLSACYDVATLIRAVAQVAEKHPEVRLKLLGDGVEREALEQVAAETGAPVDFLGYVPYGQMAAYLECSDILVNSLVKKAPQSVPTKIADYLAAGKPMVNTSPSPEFGLKVTQDGFGVNVEPEDAGLLAEALEKLIADEPERMRMGMIAREVAEEEFDRRRAYQATLKLIEDLIARGKR